MAHLLEHLLFKGTPKHPDIDKEFNQRGVRYNGTTWLDRTNYYELFQASDDNLDWAIEHGGRPHGQLPHRQEGPRQRDDGGAQRVRERRELALRRAAQAPAERRLRLAQLRQLDHRQPSRHRERATSRTCRRSTAPTTSPTTRCCWSRASSTREEGARAGRQALRPDPEAGAHAARVGRWSPRRTASAVSPCAARATSRSSASPTRCPRPARGCGGARVSPTSSWAHVPTGRLHKALVETGKAAQVASFRLGGVDGSLQIFGAVVKKGEPVEPVRDGADPPGRGLRRQPAQRRRRWSARA